MKTMLNKVVFAAISLLIGCVVGIVFHFMVYRLSMPVKPFVYVSF
jgi:hypothetical protein